MMPSLFGLSFFLIVLLKFYPLVGGADEHKRKCENERVQVSCQRNEKIWVKDAYSCYKCEKVCSSKRFETSDINTIWELCNLQNTCDVAVTWYQLDMDFECLPIEQIPMYSICDNIEIKKHSFQLYSPGYPNDLSNNRHCECYTELKEPTQFTVTVHHGRFQYKELEIKVDNLERGPLSVDNLPLAKELFKIDYKNNKLNTDHRLWMKVSVDKYVTITCRDVDAMPSGGGSETTNGGRGLIIALIGVGCVILVIMLVLVPAAFIYRRRQRAHKASEGRSHGPGADHGRPADDKIMLNLFGPHNGDAKQNGIFVPAEVSKINRRCESNEVGDRESNTYQVAGYSMNDAGNPMSGNWYESTDVQGDGMKDNDLYQSADVAGNDVRFRPDQEQCHMKENDLYQAADIGDNVRQGDQGADPNMKVNELYQPTDIHGHCYMKENDLYHPTEVTGYNRKPRSLPRPRALPKPRTLPKPNEAPTTLPKPKRVSEEIYQDVGV